MATDDESSVGSENTLLIATDDGKIYRLVEARWRQPEFELGGDVADSLKKRLLDNGVITAHLPALDRAFFACYLLNLAMIKEAPAPQQTPEAEPTGGGTGGKK